MWTLCVGVKLRAVGLLDSDVKLVEEVRERDSSVKDVPIISSEPLVVGIVCAHCSSAGVVVGYIRGMIFSIHSRRSQVKGS